MVFGAFGFTRTAAWAGLAGFTGWSTGAGSFWCPEYRHRFRKRTRRSAAQVRNLSALSVRLADLSFYSVGISVERFWSRCEGLCTGAIRGAVQSRPGAVIKLAFARDV